MIRHTVKLSLWDASQPNLHATVDFTYEYKRDFDQAPMIKFVEAKQDIAVGAPLNQDTLDNVVHSVMQTDEMFDELCAQAEYKLALN
jgi:hypothetical protein